MKKEYSYWIEYWQKSKNFRVENDRIKPKSYLFSSFPKTNLYGFQDGNLRPLLVGDFYSRYQRMAGYNVLFPTGFDSLGLSSFMENKKHSNTINDDISNLFAEQMLKLGVGVDKQKQMDLKHDEYVASLQLAFIELYERGYIRYDSVEVLQDKTGKKIVDPYFYNKKLSFNRVKAFYLDISQIKDQVLENIDGLNVSGELRQQLKAMLEPKVSLTIPFAVTNGTKISVTLKEPEYLGGISYISIHPDYVDFSLYTLYEEFPAIEKYLSDDNMNDFGVFSGTYAINPLTGKRIPIFVSVKYDCDIYVANPFLNPEDRITALEEGLPAVDVVQNGVFIESDFLNGIPVEEGRRLLTERFSEADMCTLQEYYSKDKILVSSYDTFGALLPFLKDSDDKIYSLKQHLPFVFSPKFRPILSEDIDVPGSIMPGSINHNFSSGMISILALLYDDIGASISIFSTEALQLFQSWNGIELMVVPMEELFEHVLIPLCILTILQKEKKVSLPPLFKQLELVSPSFTSNYLPMNRENHTLFEIAKYLDEYHGDALRLYFLGRPLTEDFIFSEEELASTANLIKAIEAYYSKDFVSSNSLASDFKTLIEQCHQYLWEKQTDAYVGEVLRFYKTILWNKDITAKQGLLFLKLLYPICPFLAEDIYHSIFKGKYLISDDGWIN